MNILNQLKETFNNHAPLTFFIAYSFKGALNGFIVYADHFFVIITLCSIWMYKVYGVL